MQMCENNCWLKEQVRAVLFNSILFIYLFNCWIAHCLRSLAAKPKVRSSIPQCALLRGAGLDDP